tara:strand:- start:16 stop:1467 length:1452 start_codon:yes stop_codon:yes gene_type:complete
MSEVKVNKISPRANCGTVTLGDSGDTIALGAGASQTGFGRTGTVDWQTTKKTTDFTAVNGEGYFVDTGSGVVTVTLPASPSAGNIVYVKDYDGNFGSSNCIIARNGSNIRGATNNVTLENDNAGVVLIYVDATEGWQLFFDGSDADAQATFLEATGGTVSCVGNFKIHKFTGPGSFDVSKLASSASNNVVDYLVVGGGGAGSHPNGGAGGAGGYRESHNPTTSGCYTASPLAAPNSPQSASLPVSVQSYTITVGAGGAAMPYPGAGPARIPGSVSTFSTITSAGGGGGGIFNISPPGERVGEPGGSGGGGSIGNPSSPTSAAGGSGNTPSVTPAQGTDGGTGFYVPSGNSGGGGGGASEAGQNSTAPSGSGAQAGRGGAGTTSEISGAATAYAGGGGAGAGATCKGGATSPCGTGGFGGGNPSTSTPAPSRGAPQPLQPTLPSAPAESGSSGVVNTGGGGGGTNSATTGGGGSGIVIIRYKAR